MGSVLKKNRTTNPSEATSAASSMSSSDDQSNVLSDKKDELFCKRTIQKEYNALAPQQPGDKLIKTAEQYREEALKDLEADKNLSLDEKKFMQKEILETSFVNLYLGTREESDFTEKGERYFLLSTYIDWKVNFGSKTKPHEDVLALDLEDKKQIAFEFFDMEPNPGKKINRLKERVRFFVSANGNELDQFESYFKEWKKKKSDE